MLNSHFLTQTKCCFIPFIKRSQLLPDQVTGEHTGHSNSCPLTHMFLLSLSFSPFTYIQVYRQRYCTWTCSDSLQLFFILYQLCKHDRMHLSLCKEGSSDTSCMFTSLKLQWNTADTDHTLAATGRTVSHQSTNWIHGCLTLVTGPKTLTPSQ